MPNAIASPPTIVYLHGVGDGDPTDGWQPVLDKELEAAGYPGLDGVTIIAPKYPNSLFDGRTDDVYELPPVLEQAMKKDELAEHRRRLERRRADLEARLGRELPKRPHPIAAAELSAVGVHVKQQAKRYLSNTRQSRARVLTRVLHQIPPTGDIVLIGHSLGSLVALDVVRRLPRTVTVKALITLGSPASHDAFHRGSDRLELRTPPPNVDVWLNFWSGGDPITFRSGVTRHFPWVLDIKVPVRGHRARKYFANPTVAKAIGWFLFGSTSRELVPVESGVDIPLNPTETLQLLQLTLAHTTRDQLSGELRQRFNGALAVAQAQRASDLAAIYATEKLPAPRAIAQLIADNEEFTPEPTRPDCPRHLTKAEAALLVIGVAQQNPIAPFQIDLKDDVRRAAIEQLTIAMQLGSKFGRHVDDALDFARDQLKVKRSAWKWVAVGAGAVVVIAGTGGLALAATPGLAGAAAVTSALATFGPGGMVGGLVTAGLLTGGGSAAVAGSLARLGSVESVEDFVVFQLAHFKLCDLEGLEQTDEAWYTLVSLEGDLLRELGRLEPFSDDKSPTIGALRQKLRTVRAAVECIVANDWAATEADDDANSDTQAE